MVWMQHADIHSKNISSHSLARWHSVPRTDLLGTGTHLPFTFKFAHLRHPRFDLVQALRDMRRMCASSSRFKPLPIWLSQSLLRSMEIVAASPCIYFQIIWKWCNNYSFLTRTQLELWILLLRQRFPPFLAIWFGRSWACLPTTLQASQITHVLSL